MSSLVFHNRWSVPVLAELDRTAGSRFVNLSHGLGVSRESLRRTLSSLVRAGLVRRNPGYGHPLRPEYVLTADGTAVAPAAAALLAELRRLGLEDVGLRKWPVPVLHALAAGALRFSELRAALPGATPRALTLALKELADAGLVRRTVTDDFPPATVYRLEPRARGLVRAASPLL